MGKSVVSEGGTRRKVKMKRIRDEDGNVIGYGDAIPADVRESSITGKRGSLGDSDNEGEEAKKAREHLKELERQMGIQDERTIRLKAKEAEKQRALEERKK